MLFDPDRHESLRAMDWDERRVRLKIQQIVDDAEEQFDATDFWPPHPKDAGGSGSQTRGLTPLYMGACGVIWALHYLQDVGAVELKRSYRPFLDAVRNRNQEWLGEVYVPAAASFLMGDTPFLMLGCANPSGDSVCEDRLAALIAANMVHPHRELMWGSPGTLLAAWFLHERTDRPPWADLFRRTADKLRSQLEWSEEFQCHYWTQDMYGRQSTYLDGVHGFAATAFALTKGRGLLDPATWHTWEQCIVNTIERTATVEGGLANWRVHLNTPVDEKPRLLMQYCHGAPGFVICLADLPSPSLDRLLLAAGEAVWAAGPLKKGSNLCHGTGGNGYAFLKLFQRTGELMWMQRARAFAMHGIVQTEADQSLYGRAHYSLWTGDLGFAIYLRDCLTGRPGFPTLDTFYGSKYPT